jgi:hypothetical protein
MGAGRSHRLRWASKAARERTAKEAQQPTPAPTVARRTHQALLPLGQRAQADLDARWRQAHQLPRPIVRTRRLPSGRHELALMCPGCGCHMDPHRTRSMDFMTLGGAEGGT